MNLISKFRKVLNEAAPDTAMDIFADRMQRSNYMNKDNRLKVPEATPPKEDVKATPETYATKLPCVVYIGSNGEHANEDVEEKRLTADNEIISDFATHVARYFSNYIAFADEKNYEATLFVKNGKDDKPLKMRYAKVVEGTNVKTESYAEIFEMKISLINTENKEEEKVKNSNIMSPDDAKKSAADLKTKVKALAIEKPTKEFLDKNYKTLEAASSLPEEDSEVFSVEIKSDQPAPDVKIVTYTVVEYLNGERFKLKNTSDNSEKEYDYKEVASKFYVGPFKGPFDYRAAVSVHLTVSQLSGKEKGNNLTDISVYTSFEKYEEFAKQLNSKDSTNLRESVNHPAINEDDNINKEWRAIVHLSYYDNNEDDNLDANPTRKIRVKAPTEEQAVKYAENYIRKQALELKEWKGAYIENIEEINEESTNED